MSDSELDAILEGLASPDPRQRALTVQRVRQVDLDNLDLLDAVLAVCRDSTPLPEDMQPPTAEDPFAEFFGGSGTKSVATVGDKATERLVFTGVIGKPETAEHLARALEDSPPPHLVKAIVKVLGETRWSDRLGAVRTLVGPLHRADAAMYEVVVRLKEAEHRAMIKSALDPYNSRAVNELLNHGPSKALMEDALSAAVLDDSMPLDEPIAADILTLLVSWDSAHAKHVARKLEGRFPWAVIPLALYDAEAGPRLQAWLKTEAAAPAPLVRKLEEALKTHKNIAHFPLPEWLLYAGGVGIARLWGAQARCKTVLEGFVAAWADDPARAWESSLALVEAGLHQEIGEAIRAGLADDTQAEHWTRSTLELLSTANPPIPGLLEAATDLVLRHPTRSRQVVPALMGGYEASALRPLAEAYIALAEGCPVVRKPAQKGLIHEERQGVDPAPFQALVSQLEDAPLMARLQEVLPYVRAE